MEEGLQLRKETNGNQERGRFDAQSVSSSFFLNSVIIFVLISIFSHETGRSLSRIAEEWGYGDQALAKEFDDSSPDWVTEDEDDPALLETRYRDDDMRNEGIDAMPSEEMVAFCKANGPKLIHAHGNMRPKLSKNFEWRHWCKTWLAATKIFLKKASKVDSNHCLAHVISPHDFFDDMDRAVWRTLVHSPLMCDENDWVSLPGPASWWDDGYDFKHHGWEVTESFVMIEARKAALAILKGREKPKGFEDMTWSTKELMILALA